MTTNATKPANRLREPLRDPSGKLLPGATLNPTGRPKVWREFQEAVRERTPEALKIIDQALKSKDPEMRRWACERVLGYAWGRPPQRVQIGGDEDAPPVQVGRAIDWSRLPPERLGQLLGIMDSLEAAGADPG
jgi:hypothetical protein